MRCCTDTERCTCYRCTPPDGGPATGHCDTRDPAWQRFTAWCLRVRWTLWPY